MMKLELYNQIFEILFGHKNCDLQMNMPVLTFLNEMNSEKFLNEKIIFM